MEQAALQCWPASQKILFRFFFIFVLLFVNSFSFPHQYIPDPGNFTAGFYEMLVKWTATNILHIRHSYTSSLISDSTGMYIHVLNLVIISLIVSSIWSMGDRSRKNYNLLCHVFFVFIRYYLAMQLLMYGCSKIFKWQFYLPEPNTLFTTLGNLPKDLLYWSLMGSSRSYTIFAGTIEVMAGLLLLFRRTKLLGAIIAAGTLLNVVLINFSFDISVKLYSCFLLLLCFVIIAPDVKRLFYFFVLHKNSDERLSRQLINSKQKFRLYVLAKTLVIALLFADALSMYLETKNFNDDSAPRPLLHGGYEVQSFVKNADTLLPLLTDKTRWRRMFVHRQGYLIVQFMNDEMKDYQLEYDTANQKLILHDYDSSQIVLRYSLLNDTVLILNGAIKNDTVNIHLNKIDLKYLPVLRNEFNWTIDQ